MLSGRSYQKSLDKIKEQGRKTRHATIRILWWIFYTKRLLQMEELLCVISATGESEWPKDPDDDYKPENVYAMGEGLIDKNHKPEDGL